MDEQYVWSKGKGVNELWNNGILVTQRALRKNNLLVLLHHSIIPVSPQLPYDPKKTVAGHHCRDAVTAPTRPLSSGNRRENAQFIARLDGLVQGSIAAVD